MQETEPESIRSRSERRVPHRKFDPITSSSTEPSPAPIPSSNSIRSRSDRPVGKHNHSDTPIASTSTSSSDRSRSERPIRRLHENTGNGRSHRLARHTAASSSSLEPRSEHPGEIPAPPIPILTDDSGRSRSDRRVNMAPTSQVTASDSQVTAVSHPSQQSTIPYEDCRSTDSQATIPYDAQGNPINIPDAVNSSGMPLDGGDANSDSDASTIPEFEGRGPELFSHDSTFLFDELIYHSTYHARATKSDEILTATSRPEFELSPLYAAMLEAPISLDGDEV
jgi:hypothetical protein